MAAGSSMRSRMSSTSAVVSTRPSSASGVSSMRWPITAGATMRTSSGVTNGRAWAAASARAVRTRAMAPRVDTPRRSWGMSRVAAQSRTM